MGFAAAVLTENDQVEVTVAIVVTPGHGRLLERPQTLLGRDELLDVEHVFLRPGGAGEGAIYRLDAPVIDVWREGHLQTLIGLKTGVARARRDRPGEDIAAARFGADAQIVGQRIALGIGARSPAEDNATAGHLGLVEAGRWSRQAIGAERALVIVEQGAAFAIGIDAADQQVGAAIAVVVAPCGRAAGQSFELGFGGHAAQLSSLVFEDEGLVRGEDGAARGGQIGIAIVVVVGPGQVAGYSPGGAEAKGLVLGQNAGGAVAIEQKRGIPGGHPVGDAAVDRQIEIAVAVIILPGQASSFDLGGYAQGIVEGEGAGRVVEIEFGDRSEAPGSGHVFAGDGQIEIAIVVVVGPGKVAVV